MPASTRTFASILERSDLLSPQQLEAAVRIAARPLGDRAVAQQLVQKGLLTPFQAEEILAGRYRRLRINDYVLTGVIGVGGMGSVFRALDRAQDRQVALKVLSERFKHDTGMQARLRLEAKAGMRLDHPNLLKVFDHGQTDDVFGEVDYLVMELFEGIALHELVGFYGPLPPAMACDLICQAAAGLEAMHQVGMVHRDVKPENLLVDCSGEVKIIDYGLAIAHEMSFDDEFSLAMIFGHDCPGTADYMAPEQFTDGLSADARADIYALGCTLFGALCACRPFRASTRTAFRRAHQESPRPNVAEHAESIPPELNAIVLRMMAVDREQRFDSMQQVVDALKPFAKRKPIEFDFEKLTKKRITIARKKEERRRTGAGGGGSGARSSSATRSTASTTQANRPTELPRIASMSASADSSPVVLGDRPSAPFQPDTAAQQADRLVQTLRVGDAAAKAQNARLVFTDGRRVLLHKAVCEIGRSTSCEVCLDVADLSSQHCRIWFDGRTWMLADLDSKNGTLLNGEPVKSVMLAPNDVVQLGGVTTFRFERDAPESSSSAGWLIAAVVAVLGIAGAAWWLLQ